MVVNNLGAVVLTGIREGCFDFSALLAWCDSHGFAAGDEAVQLAVATLLSSLAAAEIIEPDPAT
jgi:hypothetical protein